jgi:hypothetical protein
MLIRQRHSSKLTYEQIQRKFAENGFHKDDLLKNAPVIITTSNIQVLEISTSRYYVHENELLFRRLSLVNEVKSKFLFYCYMFNHHYSRKSN